MVRRRGKLSRDHKQKVGVWLSNGLIFSARGASVAAKSSGPYSPNRNSHLDHNASVDADFLKKSLLGMSRFAKKILGIIFAPKIEKFLNYCIKSMKFLNNF
jgi:hypothetical protein